MLRFLLNMLPTLLFCFFFFNDTATTEIYTLSLHDALPNYTQMRQALPLRAWNLLRAVSVACAFGVILLLLVAPAAGLKLWWGLVVPVLPLVFFAAPGLWRNLCPMAALNQTPRVFGFTRGLALSPRLREYGYVLGIA